LLFFCVTHPVLILVLPFPYLSLFIQPLLFQCTIPPFFFSFFSREFLNFPPQKALIEKYFIFSPFLLSFFSFFSSSLRQFFPPNCFVLVTFGPPFLPHFCPPPPLFCTTFWSHPPPHVLAALGHLVFQCFLPSRLFVFFPLLFLILSLYFEWQNFPIDPLDFFQVFVFFLTLISLCFFFPVSFPPLEYCFLLRLCTFFSFFRYFPLLL